MTTQCDSEMWNRYVNQDPVEFMELSEIKEVRGSVEEYLTHLDEMFGAGTSAEAPSDLAECLVRYIAANRRD